MKRPCTYLGFLSSEITKIRYLKNAWERIAKREYRCTICDFRIPKGSQYIGTEDRVHGKRLRFYYHIKCLLEEDGQEDLVERFLNINKWKEICFRCGAEKPKNCLTYPQIKGLCGYCRTHCKECEVFIHPYEDWIEENICEKCVKHNKL